MSWRKWFLSFVILAGVAYFLSYTFLPCFHPFGNVICQGAKNLPWVALTFDDGPQEPFTSQILNILNQYQVKATFFVVGKAAQKYPETVQKIILEGHAIGNHSQTHQTLQWADRSTTLEEIEEWEKAIPSLPFSNSKLFRAPHGWKSLRLPSLLEQKGYQLVGWTHGVWDTDKPGVSVLQKRLSKTLHNGSIILLHDGEGDVGLDDRSQTVAALPSFIEEGLSKGFRFVTLPEMMKNE